jgi:hypothetical protein
MVSNAKFQISNAKLQCKIQKSLARVVSIHFQFCFAIFHFAFCSFNWLPHDAADRGQRRI